MTSTIIENYFIVEVMVVNATNLVTADFVGICDPYVIVFDKKHHSFRTSTKKKTSNPEFNELFDLTYITLPEFLNFRVYDHDKTLKDNFIGWARLKLSAIKLDQTYRKDLILRGVPNGMVHIHIKIKKANRLAQLKPKPLGILRVVILDGKIFKKPDYLSKNDPYVTVIFGHQAYKTHIIKGNEPVWNVESRIWVHEYTEFHRIQLGLWDAELINDKLIGNYYLNINDRIGENLVNKNQEFWIDIPAQHQVKDSHITGARHHGNFSIDLGSVENLHEKMKRRKKEKKKVEKIQKKQKLKKKKVIENIDGLEVEHIGKLRIRLVWTPIEELEKMFWETICEYFDVNNNKMIDHEELRRLLEVLDSSLTSEEIDEKFKEMDTDNKGALTFEQIRLGLHNISGITTLKKDPISGITLKGMNEYEKLVTIALNIDSTGSDIELLMDSYIPAGIKDPKKRLKSTVIHVFDRKTGQIVEELIPKYIRSALRSMYRSKTSRKTIGTQMAKSWLKKITDSQGRQKRLKKSKLLIKPFIKEHNIKIDEILQPLEEFKSFNDFFIRKLKPECRPIYEKENPLVAVSPADCRMCAFHSVAISKELWIKGKNFTLQKLFNETKDPVLAKKYAGGSVLIARLSPQDYHRLHFPVTGTVEKIHPVIPGEYYTVSPLAINTDVDVYTENKRQIVELSTGEFGDVVCVWIGATCVGGIVLEVEEGDSFTKGDPHGYFHFGGSTQLIIFQPGKIAFDNDLLHNSNNGMETLMKMGIPVGVGNEKEVKKMKKDEEKEKESGNGSESEKETETETEKKKEKIQKREKEKKKNKKKKNLKKKKEKKNDEKENESEKERTKKKKKKKEKEKEETGKKGKEKEKKKSLKEREKGKEREKDKEKETEKEKGNGKDQGKGKGKKKNKKKKNQKKKKEKKNVEKENESEKERTKKKKKKNKEIEEIRKKVEEKGKKKSLKKNEKEKEQKKKKKIRFGWKKKNNKKKEKKAKEN
ncbi:phosphatidylserine decarboxylase [Anaeramoeba flamelloides]|uniref:Phosphatidylserine decarboxylase n=1 Tax=Anaeramoeba flamelloides TaxID=1746091 RepID=A0ABQ8XKB2_9EUKA|nr:phosphatidylserine decarboxylase [Anaeramoeba flamelloides]